MRLAVPEQEVVQQDGGWTVRYRAPLASEEHNAQVSLLCGIAAAALMLRSGTGILRTQPPPEERDLERLRRTAEALAVPWPAEQSYPEFVRTLDPAKANHAAVIHEAGRVAHGAGYTAFDGTRARGRGALGRRRALRARDGTTAPAAGPLRVRVLSR